VDSRADELDRSGKIGLRPALRRTISSLDDLLRAALRLRFRQYDDGQTRALARVGLATMVMR
jgi:hypothetical protein